MTEITLSGKVAIVTGGSRGIGADIARTLARAGAKVVVASRKQEGVERMAAEIRADGGKAIGVVCHTGYREQVQALVAQTIERWGHVDIAVNNAATNVHVGSILDTDEAMWDKVLQVNLKGYLWLAQAVMPRFRAQGVGKLINIASIGGIVPGPYAGLYSISKAGVISLTMALAQEVGGENIQVNAIAPGVIETRFSAPLHQNEAVRRRLLERAGRIGQTGDVANAVLFLASPMSDYINGTILTVDGGTMVSARL
jgi:NAD(P)-dependent dehydrogenase (short-subunit alcohol dehydrogenase family)